MTIMRTIKNPQNNPKRSKREQFQLSSALIKKTASTTVQFSCFILIEKCFTQIIQITIEIE